MICASVSMVLEWVNHCPLPSPWELPFCLVGSLRCVRCLQVLCGSGGFGFGWQWGEVPPLKLLHDAEEELYPRSQGSAMAARSSTGASHRRQWGGGMSREGVGLELCSEGVRIRIRDTACWGKGRKPQASCQLQTIPWIPWMPSLPLFLALSSGSLSICKGSWWLPCFCPCSNLGVRKSKVCKLKSLNLPVPQFLHL